MPKKSLENPISNKIYDGCSKSELLEILKYEIEVYRNEVGLDDMSEYDAGFADALKWCALLLDPEQKDPKWDPETEK